MDRQPIDLGFILRQFPRFEFSMDTFEQRLRVQKFVYLLEACDVYLGYDYSWYLRGPYCSTLAASAFALTGFYHQIPQLAPMYFSNSMVDANFARFKEFIKDHEADTDFLEIAASFHFLEKAGSLSSSQVFERVLNKRDNFTEEQCRGVLSHLERHRIVEAGGTGGGNSAPPAASAPECRYGESPCEDWFVQAKGIPEPMNHRPIDKGFYHMLLDSKEGGEKIVLVGQNVFKVDQERPPIDEITVENDRLLVDLIQRR